MDHLKTVTVTTSAKKNTPGGSLRVVRQRIQGSASCFYCLAASTSWPLLLLGRLPLLLGRGLGLGDHGRLRLELRHPRQLRRRARLDLLRRLDYRRLLLGLSPSCERLRVGLVLSRLRLLLGFGLCRGRQRPSLLLGRSRLPCRQRHGWVDGLGLVRRSCLPRGRLLGEICLHRLTLSRALNALARGLEGGLLLRRRAGCESLGVIEQRKDLADGDRPFEHWCGVGSEGLGLSGAEGPTHLRLRERELIERGRGRQADGRLRPGKRAQRRAIRLCERLELRCVDRGCGDLLEPIC